MTCGRLFLGKHEGTVAAPSSLAGLHPCIHSRGTTELSLVVVDSVAIVAEPLLLLYGLDAMKRIDRALIEHETQVANGS